MLKLFSRSPKPRAGKRLPTALIPDMMFAGTAFIRSVTYCAPRYKAKSVGINYARK